MNINENPTEEKNTIREEWHRLLNEVAPELAQESIQYVIMRRTFFAGFVAALMKVQEIPEDWTDEQINMQLQRWYDEFKMLIGVEHIHNILQQKRKEAQN